MKTMRSREYGERLAYITAELRKVAEKSKSLFDQFESLIPYMVDGMTMEQALAAYRRDHPEEFPEVS
jgi:hypothetical protein